MSRVEFLYLSQPDVMAIGMSMADVIAVVEQSLAEHGLGYYENPPKPVLHPPGDDYFHAMPGLLPRKKVAGLKWVSGFFSNPSMGLPSLMGLTVLNSVETGQPLAVMDCAWVTAMRTGAVSGVAAKYLAPPEAESIGLVGTGVQGVVNILALTEVLPQLKLIKAFDIDARVADRFATSLAAHSSIAVVVPGSARDAIEDSDVVVTCTGKLHEPIFEKRWLKPGALVLPIHSSGWDKDMPFIMDKFVVDDWAQFSKAQVGNHGYYGRLPDPDAQLGEIVAGKKPGRENSSQQILNHNYGMAIHDVLMAKELVSRAKTMGIGTVLPLTDGEPVYWPDISQLSGRTPGPTPEVLAGSGKTTLEATE